MLAVEKPRRLMATDCMKDRPLMESLPIIV
jgi:hypothetical protein